MDEIERARLRRYVEKVENRSGLDVLQLIAMALDAEARGASPGEVRAILDGDLGARDEA